MVLANARIGGLALLVAFGLGAAPAQAQTTLRYKFKQGDQLNYAMEQKMTIKMNVQGMDVVMKMNQTIDMTQQVQSVDSEGKAKLAQKFERWRMSMHGPMGKTELDSKDNKEPEGPLGQALGPLMKAMAGGEFTMTMDTRGEISNVKVPEAFLKAIKDNQLPGIGDMFSDEGLKRMMSQNGLILPKEAAEKGKSWEVKSEMKMPFGKMALKTANTYEGPAKRSGKDVEKVAFKIDMTLEPDPNSPVTIKMKVEEAKGTAYFDNAAGRLVEVNATQIMSMDIAAGGQNITQRIETTLTMKLK